MAALEAELAQLREVKCPVCEGTGMLSKQNKGAEPIITYTIPCTICNGTGFACGELKS
jgi:DnaJ-class molecular chaperone